MASQLAISDRAARNLCTVGDDYGEIHLTRPAKRDSLIRSFWSDLPLTWVLSQRTQTAR